MIRFLSCLFVFVFVFNIFCTNASSVDKYEEEQKSNPGVNASVLTSNLSHPWELCWGPDAKIWITEKSGRVSRVDTGTGDLTLVYTIPDVRARGEGGLLGLTLHPDFKSNPYVFVAYNYHNNDNEYVEKIVRYQYNGSTLTDPVVLLDGIAASNIHNGCRLLISEDKKLFITTGDAASSSKAQNMSSLNGKVLRLNLDGSIPSDNPDPSSPVWSLGHRNAQGLVFAKGKLYSSEHGPSGDDEINIIQKGRNYGWPNVEGFCDRGSEKAFCSAKNVAQPLYAWTPTLAVAGLDYYDKGPLRNWKNSLLMTTLKDNTLYQLKLNDTGDKVESVREYLRGDYGRLRDVCVSPDGKVFVSTGNGSGDRILKITGK